MLTDTHCHLNIKSFDNMLDEVINSARNEGVNRILVPGIDLHSSKKAIAIAEKFDIVYAAVGIHPNEGLSWDSFTKRTLMDLTKHPKVIAVGEIGLDLHWDSCPLNRQIELLKEQLSIAQEMELPVILHSRDSLVQVFSIIEDWTRNLNTTRKTLGVFHSFEGNITQTKDPIAWGFKIGIAGPVTFKNAADKQLLAAKLPLDQFVIETDAPYLTPHPFRGKKNKPEYVKLVAEKIAQIREISVKLVEQETSKNANDLFAWEY